MSNVIGMDGMPLDIDVQPDTDPIVIRVVVDVPPPPQVSPIARNIAGFCLGFTVVTIVLAVIL